MGTVEEPLAKRVVEHRVGETDDSRAHDRDPDVRAILLCADGTAFWNQLSVSPVFDGEGSLVNYVGVQIDVTERVRVESEREAALVRSENRIRL